VCNETYKHRETLLKLSNAGYAGLCISEKPLLARNEDFNAELKNLKVSYNLRFHPLLKKLKDDLKNESVTGVNCYVGQYLPTWRAGSDYSQNYSAQSDKGGGVLLDLSHEIDFCQWIFGDVQGLFARGGKYSDLTMTAEDSVHLILQQKKADVVSITLNCTDRISQRFICVNTNTKTFKLDLVKRTYQVNDQVMELAAKDCDTYLFQAQDVMNGASSLTTFNEALKTMQVINSAYVSMNEKKWVSL
jgi:predicted dehydrogenase